MRRISCCAAMLLLSGCLGSGLSGEAGKTLKTATDKASASFNEANAELVRAERIVFASKLNDNAQPGPSQQILNDKFAEFACLGIGANADIEAAFATLAEINGAVAVLVAPPASDFDDLMESISKYSGKSAGLNELIKEADGSKKEKASDKESQKDKGDENKSVAEVLLSKCKEEVGNYLNNESVSKLAQKMQSEGEKKLALLKVTDAVSAFSALVKALKAVAIASLQQVDIAQRHETLKNFLNASETQKAVTFALGPCAVDTELVVEGSENKQESGSDNPQTTITVADCLKKDASKAAPLSDTRLEALMKDRRLNALVIPAKYFPQIVSARREAYRLEILSEEQSRYAEELGNATDKPEQKVKTAEMYLAAETSRDKAFAKRAMAIKIAEETHGRLALFDELRLKKSPEGQHQKMVEAMRELRRVANLKLTGEEWLKAFRSAAVDAIAAFESTKDAIEKVPDEVDALRKALKELGVALNRN